jgi:hypothetical protein
METIVHDYRGGGPTPVGRRNNELAKLHAARAAVINIGSEKSAVDAQLTTLLERVKTGAATEAESAASGIRKSIAHLVNRPSTRDGAPHRTGG